MRALICCFCFLFGLAPVAARAQGAPEPDEFDIHPTRKIHREYVAHSRQQYEADPANLERMLEYGRALYGLAIERDKTAAFEAERIFAGILQKAPQHPVAMAYSGALKGFKIGSHLVPNDQITDTLRMGFAQLDEAVEREPRSLEIRYLRAYSSFYTPSFFARDTRAVEDFQFILKRLETRPNQAEEMADCRLVLGDTFLKMENPEAAAREWRQVLEQFPTDSPQALSARYRLQSLSPGRAAQALVYEEMLACLGFLLGAVIFGMVAIRSGSNWRTRQHAQRSIRLAVVVSLLVCGWNLINLVVWVAGALECAQPGPVWRGFSWFHHGWGLLVALLPIPLGFAVAYRAHKASFMDWLLKRGAAVLILALLAIAYSQLFTVVLQAAVLWLSSPSLRSMVVILLPMSVIALFVPLYRWVNTIVDIYVFKRHNQTHLLEWFGERLRPITDETTFRRVLSETLTEGLAASSVQVLLTEDARTRKLLDEGTTRQSVVLETDLLADEGLRAELQRKQFELVLILQAGSGPAGVILLGSRTHGLGYLSEEQHLLRSMAVEAGRTLETLRLHEIQRRERNAQETLRNLISEAELRALRAQINPHFFFNALNSVAALIGDDPQKAEELLADLADFFRHAFNESRAWHSLREELNLVEAYLKIEKVRLGNKLQVRTIVPASLTGQRIPALSIQPLVENAVKHGIAKVAGGGTVTVSVTGLGDQLEIFVADTGCGMTAAELTDVRSRGVGLSNVHRRLVGLFGPHGGLRIDSRPGEGTTVSFTVPLVNESPAEPMLKGVGDDTHTDRG